MKTVILVLFGLSSVMMASADAGNPQIQPVPLTLDKCLSSAGGRCHEVTEGWNILFSLLSLLQSNSA
jgi:hypothetical protein